MIKKINNYLNIKKMNKFLFPLFLIILFKYSFLLTCPNIQVKPYESNHIYIERNTTKCVLFSFDNPSEGNIILKLARSNSFTSIIYIYENEELIHYNENDEQFEGYYLKYQIGEDFYKEQKIEEMAKQKYYFIIFENDFYFDDDLIIYNDNFKESNYYEISQIENNQINEYNFKYQYTNENPILIHFKTPANNVNLLNYQFLNINDEGVVSFYIYSNNNFDSSIETVQNKKEHSNYIELKPNADYHIKIITNGEIYLMLEFLNSLFLKITPDDTFQKEIITSNDYYFYIEKELIYENDEYFNEFTLKLDTINLEKLPFEIKINTCDDNSSNKLKECVDNTNIKTIIKRDIDIPYVYHIYYGFNGKNNLAIKISNKNALERKQRIIIEASGGNELVDNKHDKVFTDNKGYLYPVYLNVSINEINDELNKNKSRILFIYTNTTAAIKIFYNEDTFKKDSIDIKKDEYFTIENYVYGFDFNKDDVKELFGNRKYFTIMIYCPWESSPISFQLTFINDNIYNFNYIIGDTRPLNSPIKINIMSPDEKYYFIGQYNEYATNILFNEVVYGKIKVKYKFFNGNEKISRLIFNETANGYTFSYLTPLHSRIDIIEVTCISPALAYMHFIDDQAFHINNIILEKGSQNYIYLNNTNTYNLGLSNDLKDSKGINIEVFIVSQREKQNIEIVINDNSFNLNLDNNYIRYNTEGKALETFVIKGKGTATAIRVKIGIDEKILAFYQEYNKNDEKNKISKQINIDIINRNDKNVKLCYTLNFADPDLLYIPKDENCFEINKNDKTVLTMFNPWGKYLLNDNRLYTDTDSYYLIIYVEDNSLLEKLEFKPYEEFLDYNAELKQNEFITFKDKQNNIIKSSQEQNQTILIQFSPKKNINPSKDKYVIKSQFDEIIQEGNIYNKKNRTYAIFNDQLIDSFLELDIQDNNEYEVKYSIISNENNIALENINDNYELELINSNSEPSYIQFKPLLTDKNVNYTVYISFDTKIDLLSISNLKSLKNDDKTIFIYKQTMNTKNNLVKFNLNADISKQLKNKQWILNVLAEEKDIFNIIMSYDSLKGGEDKKPPEEEQNEEKSGGGTSAGTVLLWILIILLICGAIYAAYYYFHKKKFKKDTDLLKDINDVNVSMEDQSDRGLNTEEGLIK